MFRKNETEQKDNIVLSHYVHTATYQSPVAITFSAVSVHVLHSWTEHDLEPAERICHMTNEICCSKKNQFKCPCECAELVLRAHVKGCVCVTPLRYNRIYIWYMSQETLKNPTNSAEILCEFRADSVKLLCS